VSRVGFAAIEVSRKIPHSGYEIVQPGDVAALAFEPVRLATPIQPATLPAPKGAAAKGPTDE